MRTLAERLKWALDQSRLSQRALARAAGLSQRHIGFLISGERETVELKTAQAIAGALQVSLDWLANGDGPEPDAAAIRAIGDAFVAKEREAKVAPESPPEPSPAAGPDPEAA